MNKAAALSLALVLACSKDPPPQAPEPVMPSAAATTAVVPTATVAATATIATTAAPSASGASTAAGEPDPGLPPHLHAETAGDVSDWKLHAKGLPVVSDDGQRVMYVINETDGMRGYANHRVFIKKAADDKVEKTFPIFSAAELDKAQRAKKLDDARKKVAGNVKAAQDALAAGKWTTLATASGARGKTFTAGDLSVELKGLRLTVTDKAGKKLLDYDAKGWKAKSAAAGPGQAVCVFDPALETVHVSSDKKLVAATIVHMVTSGGDSCNLSDETHVLVWK